MLEVSNSTGSGGAVEAVAVQDRLDHDQTLCQVFPHQNVSVIRRLVRTVIEHLQKLGTPQVVHELRIQTEVLG